MMTYARFVGVLLLTVCTSGAFASVSAADTTNKEETVSIIAPTERGALYDKVKHELDTDILPYWLKHAPDPVGGFYGKVDRKGKPDASAERGALLTARIMWTFSAAYRHNGDPACLAMARRAYDDLDRFFDRENGGYFWSLKADGRILDSSKSLYLQAFCIYGMSEYYCASGDKNSLDKAVALYRLLEEKCRDRANGGYVETFSRDWKLSLPRGVDGFDDKPGMKTQNTHLHVMEAYTNLLRVWPDAGLRNDLASLQDVMMEKIYDSSTHHLHVVQERDWTPFHEPHFSYGHDIEFSWLLTESAEVLGDPVRLARARAVAVDVARTTLAEGVDKDGGIYNDGATNGPDIDSGKSWWPQAEAVIGFVNAWQISGDPVFFKAAERTWDFIDVRIVDHKNGEWFHTVKRNGKPVMFLSDKIGFWKCPYHNGRVCMELMDRLGADGKSGK
jgi:cellobiose epimerase